MTVSRMFALSVIFLVLLPCLANDAPGGEVPPEEICPQIPLEVCESTYICMTSHGQCVLDTCFDPENEGCGTGCRSIKAQSPQGEITYCITDSREDPAVEGPGGGGTFACSDYDASTCSRYPNCMASGNNCIDDPCFDPEFETCEAGCRTFQYETPDGTVPLCITETREDPTSGGDGPGGPGGDNCNSVPSSQCEDTIICMKSGNDCVTDPCSSQMGSCTGSCRTFESADSTENDQYCITSTRDDPTTGGHGPGGPGGDEIDCSIIPLQPCATVPPCMPSGNTCIADPCFGTEESQCKNTCRYTSYTDPDGGENPICITATRSDPTPGTGSDPEDDCNRISLLMCDATIYCMKIDNVCVTDPCLDEPSDACPAGCKTFEAEIEDDTAIVCVTSTRTMPDPENPGGHAEQCKATEMATCMESFYCMWVDEACVVDHCAFTADTDNCPEGCKAVTLDYQGTVADFCLDNDNPNAGTLPKTASVAALAFLVVISLFW